MFKLIVDYVFLFFFFSVIGWTIESTYRSFGEKKIINTGFLNGPLCPIYGTGCLIFQICLVPLSQPIKERFWLVLPLGVALADTLEYVTSFLMEKLFHARWWDYSDNFLNINGRICFKHSCYWAVFAFAYTYLVAPIYTFAMDFIPQETRTAVVFVILAVFTVDFILTLKAAVNINRLMTKLSALRQSLLYTTEFVKSKVENIMDTAENKYERLFSGSDKAYLWKNEKISQLSEIRSQYEKLKSAGSKTTSRMFTNFTNIRKTADSAIKDIENAWKDIKAKFKSGDGEMM